MDALRLTKIVMVAGLAFYPLLVAFGNLTDYGSNFAFVQHVMSMDTTFPGNRLMYRAITAPTLQHAAYLIIIAGEGLAGVLLAYGAWRLWQARAESPAQFAAAKRAVAVGATVAFLVWFVGFLVIAGEWFAMWQSATWNGQEAAFRFVASILLVAIFVMQPEERTLA
jgi:predicted small integral membrane protein